MLQIQLDFGRTSSVLEALGNQRLLEQAVYVATETYTDEILNYIKDGRSFTAHTGELEQSIGWRPLGNGSAEVYVNADYAAYVEEGTKPHDILPKNRKALKIPVSGGGGYVLRRSAHHPGSKAYPFFFTDVDNRQQKMLESVRLVIAEAMVNG